MSHADFRSEVGTTPVFRHLTPAAIDALSAAFEAVAVTVGQVLDDSGEDLWIVGGTAEVVAISVVEHEGRAWLSAARLRRGDVYGSARLGGGLLAQVPSLDTRLEVAHGGTVWRLPANEVPGLLGHALVGRGVTRGFAPDSTAEFVEGLQRWEWAGRAPDASTLVPRERLSLIQAATIREVRVGDVLQVKGERVDRLVLVGPGAAIRASAGGSGGGPVPEWVVGPGGMLGYGVLERSASPIDIEVVQDGLILEWDRKTMRGLVGLFGGLTGSWIDGFLTSRMAIYQRLVPIAAALASSELLAGIELGKVLALLQGATLVDWRVGGAAPVPIGIQAGLGVVIDGEIVGYRMTPTLDHNSVQMLRFDATRVHRGGDTAKTSIVPMSCFGEAECARHMSTAHHDAAHQGTTGSSVNRWRARVPTKAVFIPAGRISAVMGVKHGSLVQHLPAGALVQAERLLHNCRDLVQRRIEAAQDRATLERLDDSSGRTRDELNLVWVERVRRGSPDGDDVRLLEALAEHMAGSHADGGFTERTLLVELVPGLDDDPLPDTGTSRPWLRVKLPIGERPLERLSALLHHSPRFANVLVWGAAVPGARRAIHHAVDTVLLLSRDDRASLPSDWAIETPFVYAQLVRTRADRPLPATAVRLHALSEEAAEQGWTGRKQALSRWARAVTRRQVGIALGGGGAWGWAHVALLRTAHRRGIPIDVVSGASFGSVAGGFFALGGPGALAYAIEHDRDIQAAVNKAMVTGAPIERYFDALPGLMAAWGDGNGRDGFARSMRALVPPSARTGSTLPPVPLTHTPIPFFPVATELIMGSEHALLVGSVGFGVRASGSLPPVFPIARQPGRNFADGGLSQNVPANVVETEGVSIIVASNIVPPPFIQQARPVRSGARGLISALNPVSRTLAAVVGLQTLFNRSGAVDTGLAPVVFETAWNGSMFFQIDKADTIVSDTVSDQRFWQALDGLSSRWHEVRRPRPGLGGSVVVAQGPQAPETVA